MLACRGSDLLGQAAFECRYVNVIHKFFRCGWQAVRPQHGCQCRRTALETLLWKERCIRQLNADRQVGGWTGQ